MKECVEMTHNLIYEYGLSDFCMVQSFDHEVCRTVERIN